MRDDRHTGRGDLYDPDAVIDDGDEHADPRENPGDAAAPPADGGVGGGPGAAESPDLPVEGSGGRGEAGESGAEGAPGGDDAEAGAGVEPEFHNDAELIGEESAGYLKLVKRPATLMNGKMYGAKDRRNTQDGDWKAVTHTWGTWIVSVFTKHPVVKEKEGTSLVFGESVEGARTAKSMKTMHAMALDIDSGAKLDDVLDKIEELGLCAFVYTSHSHGKSGMEVKRDEVMRKLNLTAAPTLAQVKEYLREHEKSRLEPAFIDAVEIEDEARQTKQGVQIALRTPPLDKFRVVFPLAEPVEIAGLDVSHAKALQVWENKITGLASKLLGVHFDTACTDPSRLFYMPRHPKGGEWYSAVLRGEPLRFEDVPEVSKASYAKARGGMNPFIEAGLEEDADRVPEAYTPSGRSLREWHRRAKGRYEMADMLDQCCPDRIRVSGGEKHGTVHIECPFEHEHSKEGGTGTWAGNASDSSSDYWFIQCHHDACQGRHKLEFLAQMLEDGWFDEALLTDTAYLMPSNGEDEDKDEEVAKKAWKDGPLTRADWSDDAAAEKTASDAGLGSNSSDADVSALLKRAIDGGVDDAGLSRLWDAVKSSGVRTSKREWNKLVKEHRKASRARQRDRAADQGRLDVTVEDFHEMCSAVRDRIAEKNEVEPYLFEHVYKPTIIRRDHEGRARLQHLDKDGMAHAIDELRLFEKPFGESSVRGVSAPQDVVRNVFESDYSGFLLPLRAVVRSPFFSTSGELIDQPGYHRESKVYYEPPRGLVIPPVSEKPSAEEVSEAKRLLIEEVFGDFPLGGRRRAEILEEALRGEGVPAVTNLIGLTLLPFMREMIDGPTPGHLVTKPAPGTGASRMTDVFSIIANGQPTPAMPMPTRAEEMSKTLTSVLAEGRNIVFFDNINHSVDSGELASALTAPTYSARILGRSETVEAEVRCTWVFTGNNMQLTPELIRRLVMIDLDAHVANPELRAGWRHADLPGYVTQNRGRLVWACLTLVRNWIACGKVPETEVGLASFESWSRNVGGVLKAAGLGGFMGNRDDLREMARDDREDGVQRLMAALSEYPDGTVFRASSTKGKTIGLMNVLNGGEGEDKDEPIYIDGWGYSRQEEAYINPSGIGKNFKKLATKPHRVRHGCRASTSMSGGDSQVGR